VIKSDKWILEFGTSRGISPFLEENINPASYDITLSTSWVEEFLDSKTGLVNWKSLYSPQYVLQPGAVVLASSREYVRLPANIAADLKLKSTLGRSWINHALAGWIDPGFEGDITLELQNIGKTPYTLKAGTRVAQLVFMELDAPCKTPYSRCKGRYQHQRGATPPRKDN
jgi:dCTP deaminase